MSRTGIVEEPRVRQLTAVSCPLGFVHGYRCSACNWATLFRDCHVSWAVPFCYELQVKKAFAQHECRNASEAGPSAPQPPQISGCRLCEGERSEP